MRNFILNLVFAFYYIKTNCFLLKGNNNLIKTIRPTTRFNKIIFGEQDPLKNKPNYDIRLKTRIEVFIQISHEFNQDELSIECDQNFQKFFFVQSNGYFLNIKLDSYDDNNAKTIYYSNKFASDSEINILNKNGKNFLEQSKPIQINIKTKNPLLILRKFNFSPLNIYLNDQIEPNVYSRNSSVSFNCNGEISYNFQNNSSRNVQKFILKTNYINNFLNVTYCNESYELSFKKSKDIIEFLALKTF